MTIAEGRLFALVHPYELDGRESSHPLDARGFSTMNCYLLVEDDRALLLSTGYSVHQEALLAQLKELVGDRALSLAMARPEFPAVCNARPIADRFHVGTVHQRLPFPASLFLNFRPEFPAGEGDGLRAAEVAIMRTGGVVDVDGHGTRHLEFVLPELRLLPSNWSYDDGTQTLFTGDIFSWVWHDTPAGPWLLKDGGTDPTTPQRVEHFLAHNRYWWVPGANTVPLRRSLAELFERHEISAIAPDHGCVITGGAVQRHYQLLDDFLAAAPEQASIGVAAGSWTTARTV